MKAYVRGGVNIETPVAKLRGKTTAGDFDRSYSIIYAIIAGERGINLVTLPPQIYHPVRPHRKAWI